MPGPTTREEALTWIRECVASGRSVHVPHFQERLVERRINILDVYNAVEFAADIESYNGEPRNGGTCWRVFGPTLDDDDDLVCVGIEAYLDRKARRRRVVLVTVFMKGRP